jgi:hypothetical protein
MSVISANFLFTQLILQNRKKIKKNPVTDDRARCCNQAGWLARSRGWAGLIDCKASGWAGGLCGCLYGRAYDQTK